MTMIIKCGLVLVIVVLFAFQYMYDPVREVEWVTLKQGQFVYQFSSHYAYFPGVLMSKVPAYCLPPGTSTTQSAGRLGNVILEYVSLWAMARMYNLTPFVPDHMHNRLSQVFSSLTIPPEEEFSTSEINKCSTEKFRAVFRKTTKINQKKERLDQMVERSFRYSKPIILEECVILVEAIVPLAAEIKSAFPYRDQYRIPVYETLSELRTQVLDSDPHVKEVLFIGVHVRRTDYADQLLLLYNSMRPPNEGYYGRAIQRLRSLVLPPDNSVETVQVMTSDDPGWVRTKLLSHLQHIGLKHTYFAGIGSITSPEQDMALLSHCNHSVFAYGTYGMWTALWAGGRTIVYDLDEGDAVSPAMQFARNLPLWETLK